MATSDFTCPLCGYKAPQPLFENVDEDQLRCRRCRGTFADPDAFSASASYADCDSLRPVTRFPFALHGDNAYIHVRDGYMALVVGGGQRRWVSARDCHITDLPGSIQVYYVCLSPQVTWGTQGIREFGAYGAARFSMTEEYVRAFYDGNGQVLALDDHLRRTMSHYATNFVRAEIDKQNIGLLERQDDYMGMLGEVEKGLSLVQIMPMGYRNAGGRVGTFSYYISGYEPEEPAAPQKESKPPVELLTPPKPTYTVREGVEEVFWKGRDRMERHKAGEVIGADSLRDVKRVFRFRRKEFDLPYGWGLYNQAHSASGYFSAQGTISFYIDSTVRLGELLSESKSWKEFDGQFFTNVLKKELSTAMKTIVGDISRKEDFDPEKMNSYLSAMSVSLTSLLNGEGLFGREPAFRQYGLRVKGADILGVTFYAVRR